MLTDHLARGDWIDNGIMTGVSTTTSHLFVTSVNSMMFFQSLEGERLERHDLRNLSRGWAFVPNFETQFGRT